MLTCLLICCSFPFSQLGSPTLFSQGLPNESARTCRSAHGGSGSSHRVRTRSRIHVSGTAQRAASSRESMNLYSGPFVSPECVVTASSPRIARPRQLVAVRRRQTATNDGNCGGTLTSSISPSLNDTNLDVSFFLSEFSLRHFLCCCVTQRGPQERRECCDRGSLLEVHPRLREELEDRKVSLAPTRPPSGQT